MTFNKHSNSWAKMENMVLNSLVFMKNFESIHHIGWRIYFCQWPIVRKVLLSHFPFSNWIDYYYYPQFRLFFSFSKMFLVVPSKLLTFWIPAIKRHRPSISIRTGVESPRLSDWMGFANMKRPIISSKIFPLFLHLCSISMPIINIHCMVAKKSFRVVCNILVSFSV